MTLTAAATGTAAVTLQWLKDSSPLSNDARTSGVTGNVLTVTNTTVADSGSYWVVATNACGPTPSTPVTVTVNPPAPVACALADVASDPSDTTYNPNGSIGSDDLEAFVNAFIAENAAVADVASDGADLLYNPNASVGAEDLEAFVNSFIAGC